MDGHRKTMLVHQADALIAADGQDPDDGLLELEPIPLTCLPTEILLHIFSYLNINERLKVAGVCRQWRYLIFSSARLWGTKQLRLKCSRQSQQSRRSIFFARRLGHHLRKLTVSCEHPSNHQCKYMAVCFRKLIKSLKSKKPSLTSFKVIDLRLAGANHVIITKITAVLSRLLESLSNLKSFQMSSAQWPPEEGTVVMETLLKASRNSLETLQIDGFFVPRYTPVDIDRFGGGITALTRLNKLAIDYFYLTGDIVVALADSRRGQMKKMKLLASDISPNTHCIPKLAWQHLTASCPAMKVEFCIKGFVISPSRSIPAILDPAMRISMIRLSIGGQFTFMDTPRLNMAAVLHHITTNFRKRLVRFEMDIDNHNDFLDAALIKLVKKCKHLVSLKVLAFFQSEETDMIVKDMVKERRQRQEGLGKGRQEAVTPCGNVPTAFGLNDGAGLSSSGYSSYNGVGGSGLAAARNGNCGNHNARGSVSRASNSGDEGEDPVTVETSVSGRRQRSTGPRRRRPEKVQ